MNVQTVNTIDQGRGAPQSKDCLTLDLAALDRMELPDLLALRACLYDGFRWGDAALPFIAPLWEDLVAVVESEILARPIMTVEQMSRVIVAFADPRNPHFDGLMALRPHAEAVLSTLSKSNVQA